MRRGLLGQLRNRTYPGLERASIGGAGSAELLLGQIQAAITHQSSRLRPWQRYEPLWGFLDDGLWPDDETVLRDLSFAKLALQMLTEAQRKELEAALSEC